MYWDLGMVCGFCVCLSFLWQVGLQFKQFSSQQKWELKQLSSFTATMVVEHCWIHLMPHAAVTTLLSNDGGVFIKRRSTVKKRDHPNRPTVSVARGKTRSPESLDGVVWNRKKRDRPSHWTVSFEMREKNEIARVAGQCRLKWEKNEIAQVAGRCRFISQMVLRKSFAYVYIWNTQNYMRSHRRYQRQNKTHLPKRLVLSCV